MDSERYLTKSSAVVLLAGLASLSGCGQLVEYAGGVAGAIVGEKVGEAVPVKTRVIVNPRGGRWCAVMQAQGGPVAIPETLDRPTTERLVLINEHGAKYCPGWKP